MPGKEAGGKGSGLERLERELERIFASLGHGMYVIDNERTIRLWNRAAESILGWTEEDVLGKDCRDFLGHQDDDGVQICDDTCPLKATMDGSQTIFAGTVWANKKSGELVPVNVSCAPLFDDDGNLAGAVEIFSDVTVEKEIDRVKSTLCSVVAHELRTPLTSMRGYLELVLGGDAGELNEEQRGFLQVVEESAKRLTELVNDFLDLERFESGRIEMHWENLDLEVLVDGAIRIFIPAAEKKSLKIITEFESVPQVFGDRSRIQQVITNLVSNAIKYTKIGEVRIRTRSENDKVLLEVRDTGVGIPEDELGRVGERFFRASTASSTGARGSGLGLAIAGEIIKRHEGELRIVSSLGKGSRFSVLLPKAIERTRISSPGEGKDG